MKIVRGVDAGGEVVTAALDAEGRAFRMTGGLFGERTVSSGPVEIVRPLPPLDPVQILCIGLNYRRHAEETGSRIPDWPVLFMKNRHSVIAHREFIELPTHLASSQVDFEGELAVVIGRDCKNATRENAREFVLGYLCANDVSARDWQKQFGGGQFCRGKSFDTFAPLGPCLVTADEIPDPNVLRLRTLINGEVLQDANTSDMIFDVPALIAFLSGSTTLPAGTVILTGTPSGVGMARSPQRWLRPGDEVTVEIERIGSLTNPVRAEA